jgi:hypothetical protein
MSKTNKFFLYGIDFYGKRQYRVAEHRSNIDHVLIASFTTKQEAEQLLKNVVHCYTEGVDWRVTRIGKHCLGIIVPNAAVSERIDEFGQTITDVE